MKIETKLYDYNIRAIEDAGLTEDSVDFRHMLGYVDYTNPTIVTEMLDHAEDVDSKYHESSKDLVVEFEDYNIDALKQGLGELDLEFEEIDKEQLSRMIAFALGYIDYSLE